METTTLKKKLSTYLTDKGYLKNVPDELLYEILVAWENWSGLSKEFYRAIGFSHRQMAGIIGRAKKLKREGVFGSTDFKEVMVESVTNGMESDQSPCTYAEIIWKGGNIIRFPRIDLLIEFLKKAS